MKTYIALFRGINVGGNNIMQISVSLQPFSEKLSLQDIKTYLQSGNAVFHSAEAF